MEYEIACLDINSRKNLNLCAVGLWGDLSARLLTFSDLNEICNEQLKGG